MSRSPRFEGCNILQVEKHLSIGGMKLNLAEKNVVIHGAEVMLTNREFEILYELFLHPCPHALAPGIVMAPSTSAVHTLENAVLCDSLVQRNQEIAALISEEEHSEDNVQIFMGGIRRYAAITELDETV